MKVEWYALDVDVAIARLESSSHGITSAESARRLVRDGANALPEAPRDSWLILFLRQFQSPLIYLLLVACAIVFALGESIDAIVILAVLVLNAIIGLIQEGRAEQTLSALKAFTATEATVFRDDQERIVPDQEIVVGDVVVVREGERIPADGRIIESRSLQVDEAALTGESLPVQKHADAIPGAPTETDQLNMVFRGTHAVAGSAHVLIVATGAETYIGGIAATIRAVHSEIPLQKEIKKLSTRIIYMTLVLAAALFAFGIMRGESVREMFSTVVSLTVSVVPEGLPIALTLVLATGVWRMSKRNALVKKLQAVEALGQARVIAVDKTGTLTKNEMVVTHVFVNNTLYQVEGNGYEARGAFSTGGNAIDTANHAELLGLGKIAALASEARVVYTEETKIWRVAGDPTEAAAVVLGQKLGFHRDVLEREESLVAEIPFDYRLKYRASIHERDGKSMLSLMGAPEVLLELSSHVLEDGKRVAMTDAKRDALKEKSLALSSEGLRMIALAEREGQSSADPADIKQVTFVGLMGIQDPLRPEVLDAMNEARAAGMHIVMITGDQATTARAIAASAGIYREGDTVITGAELEALSTEELAAKLDRVTVFARVTPEHKLRIVEGYKARGEVIAMTGDGVNDAPSLVAADLGVAMGKIGTEVAKEASDIVLLDDNFGSIVAAIEEGRSIYRTIKKVILYLFSTNVGEALTITGAILIAMPIPLLPTQIIWLNFVTDGFLTVALAMEPKESGLLRTAFTKASKSLVDRYMLLRMVVMAVPMAIGTLVAFSFYLDDMEKAWTISLTTLAIFQWFNAWNCRSATVSVFAMNPLRNMYLIAATLLVIGLQIVAVYVPAFQAFLHTVPLSWEEWVLCSAIASSILWIEEIRKLLAYVVRAPADTE